MGTDMQREIRERTRKCGDREREREGRERGERGGEREGKSGREGSKLVDSTCLPKLHTDEPTTYLQPLHQPPNCPTIHDTALTTNMRSSVV